MASDLEQVEVNKCINELKKKKESCLWGVPGVPVVRTQRSHSQNPGSVPGQGTKIPQAIWPGQKTVYFTNRESE